MVVRKIFWVLAKHVFTEISCLLVVILTHFFSLEGMFKRMVLFQMDHNLTLL